MRAPARTCYRDLRVSPEGGEPEGRVVRAAGFFTESHSGLYMTLFGVVFALGAPIFLGPSNALLKMAGGAVAGVALGYALDREQTPGA